MTLMTHNLAKKIPTSEASVKYEKPMSKNAICAMFSRLSISVIKEME